MFKKVLIANRGEIAVRVQRACRKLGIPTVAVYSEADKDALHVREADERVCIGPRSSTDSYLNQLAVLSAAEIKGADAIHPGYGFLAENSRFARLCEEFGFTFIGPSADAIELLGDKMTALNLARKLGVPTLSPFSRPAATPADAARQADEIGYPVLLKAAAGGGGRGMRVCRNRSELEKGYWTTRSEAGAAFGNDTVFIEKYLERPRHIEFQIVADKHGNIVYLPERECSLQRRHQKVLEESPSAVVSPELRRRMGEDAVRLAKAGGYATVGTVEFLLAPDGRHYFIEMNPRIQVEHPVTELVAGVDLIKLQIRMAAGHKLPFSQKQVRILGHAVEFRINAECPESWTPSPGKVERVRFFSEEGVRVDSALFDGYTVPPYYDSLVAKVIVKDRTRQAALRKAMPTLRNSSIQGITTNIPLHLKIIANSNFRRGSIHTGALEEILTNEHGIGLKRGMPRVA